MSDYQDKIVLVTGGTSGIGLETARKFAAVCAQVIITGSSEDKAQQALRSFADSQKVEFIRSDFRSNDSIHALFDAITSRHGRIDYAVNNAGIEGKPFTRITDYPEDVWDDVMQVNLKAVWLCMKRELSLMRTAGGGAIVNVSSLAGLQASMSGGAAYTASKHGVVGLTRSAAKEYAAEGIRVNCLCPALIKTPMSEAVIPEGLEELGARHHPIGRIGFPSDIASAAIWLCSEASAFITGISLPIDGGLIA
jgi:NAD(P)-dependent dehydrogenase (short-subunit alcohol dehydrogenase family)